MKKVLYIFLIGLAGCTSDPRQNYKIPPLPKHESQHRLQVGIEFLTNAIKESPLAAGNYFKRAELLFEQKKLKEAKSDLDEALNISPSNATFLLARAKVLRQLQQFDAALIDAQRAEVLGEDSPQLYTILGDLTLQKKRYNDSKLYLSKALQMASFDGEAYFYNGKLSAKLGDTTSAIALIQQSLDLKPRFIDSYIEITNIFARLNSFDEALKYNNLGIKYFPKDSRLYYTRGTLYHVSKRLDSALICYKQSMMLDTTNYLPNFQAGLIYLKWRNNPLSIKNFEKVARQNPKFPNINLLLGMAFERSGNLDKAIEQYTLAIQNNPSDWHTKGKLFAVQRKNTYFKQYGYLPTFSNDSTQGHNPISTTTDTTRLRINIEQPRLEIKSKTDTASRLKLKF